MTKRRAGKYRKVMWALLSRHPDDHPSLYFSKDGAREDLEWFDDPDKYVARVLVQEIQSKKRGSR